MKKILILLFFAFSLSGCSTYKFQKSTVSGVQGYLACYDDKPILEYTVGKEKSLPDLTLAKERFKRRKIKVEYYYKKMGGIESRLKEFFWEPPAMFVGLLGGVLRWPFMAIADYKYNRNPKYKERVDKLDDQKDELEKTRVNALKEKLNLYINEDLAKESLPVIHEPSEQVTVSPVIQEVIPKTGIPPVNPEKTSKPPRASAKMTQLPVKIKSVVVRKAPVAKRLLEPPVAVIIAKPAKGYSPLKVNFSSQKSYSESGEIIAYDWSFGDGDTSTKKNPENTYWSTTFGSRNFTATLTVRDNAGNTSSASTTIEVITK